MGGSEPGSTSNDPALGATLEDMGAKRAGIPEWFGERYRVTRLLGQGGMGAVYLAVDEMLVCDVALKMIAPELAGSSSGLAQLRDEVRLAQKVTHRNVCRTYDLEDVQGRWLIKMEYVAGETLAERLKKGRLPAAEVVRIVLEICAGLAAAHRQGVVHRDLKPHNVMLEAKTRRVVLMDFGIARAAALAGKTAQSVSGTPEYMAPEQVRGREVDGRADLYALGCVMYEMLVGERVFPQATAMAAALAHAEERAPALPKSVPERLRRVVALLLEKDPARRPATAEEVAAALAVATRRRGWVLGLIVVAAAAVAVVVAQLSPSHRWQAEIRELPVYDEDSDAPAFSPDGKLIAYDSDREPGFRRIYVAPIAGGTARAVTPRELIAWAPRWTRDGKALLFSDARSHRALRVSVEGGEPEPIADGADFVEDCAVRLLIGYLGTTGCAQCPRLALREPTGEERDLIRFPAGAEVYYARCDREGRRVLYSRADDPAPKSSGFHPFDLWIVPVDGGSPRRLTDDGATNIGTFTPDGRSIVYCATHGQTSHLFELTLDRAAEPVQLTFGQTSEYVPDVSSDGRSVVYDIDEGYNAIFAQLLAGGPERRITADRRSVNFLRPTPDGRAIIAQAWEAVLSDAQVVRIPLDGGDPVPLARGGTPAVASDGSEILYGAGNRVLAVPTGGGTPRLVTEVPGAVRRLQIGADGQVHLTIARPQGWEGWSAPLAGGPAARELPAPWTHVLLAPQGGWRALVSSTDTHHRWRARVLAPGAAIDDPGAPELLADGIEGAWTPDGLSFLYLRNGFIQRFWVETGEDRPILELHSSTSSLAVSSDGTTLYTVRNVGHVRRQLITNFAERPRP